MGRPSNVSICSSFLPFSLFPPPFSHYLGFQSQFWIMLATLRYGQGSKKRKKAATTTLMTSAVQDRYGSLWVSFV